jgi:hypothetical protein
MSIQDVLLSLLVGAMPNPALYSFKSDGLDELGTLDIALEVMLSQMQRKDSEVFRRVSEESIQQELALKLQENNFSVMMSLFKQWVVTDPAADLFLRSHNGLNFMLQRLFPEESSQPKAIESSEDSHKVSSDEEDAPGTKPKSLDDSNGDINLGEIFAFNDSAKESPLTPPMMLKLPSLGPPKAGGGGGSYGSINCPFCKKTTKWMYCSNYGSDSLCSECDVVTTHQTHIPCPKCNQGGNKLFTMDDTNDEKKSWCHKCWEKEYPNGIVKRLKRDKNTVDLRSDDIEELKKLMTLREYGKIATFAYCNDPDALTSFQNNYYSKSLFGDIFNQNNVGHGYQIMTIKLQNRPSYESEFSFVVDLKQEVAVQLSEIAIGIWVRTTQYEQNCAQVPLIVMAEGGMDYVQFGDRKGDILNS